MASVSEALYELCGFARVACQADLVMALEVNADGRALPAAASPVHRFTPFNLGKSGIIDQSWSTTPLPASDFRLPTALVHALDDPPALILFVPATLDHAPRSGLLLLWTQGSAPPPLVEHVPLLASSVSAALTMRREAARQAVVRDQFNDLLESVPSGIVVFDGDGRGSIINEHAAELLGCAAGRHSASELAGPMRSLRERCDNHDDLQASYAAQVGDVDYALITHWIMGERTFEVDTHPVRGDGERGRIWLFTDITAELRMADELRLQAQSDPLTGAPNRRHFEERFAQILGTPGAENRSFSVLMVDVDHFKRINDTYGHLIGDEVLKAVATRGRDALRDRDIFARFGGEEFVALLAISNGSELGTIAERVRLAVSATPIQVGDLRIDVTISVGANTRIKDATSPMEFLGTLIAGADDALYRAKQSGRNRVVVADEAV